jgi:HEPN domain-containing protein
MSGKVNDRGLLLIAKANLKAAKRDLEENDEVFINFSLFNISQCVEKLLKFQCSCNGIDYDYSHFLVTISDKLLAKGVYIPKLVLDTLNDYANWATRARYVLNQLAMRSHAEKQIACLEEWIEKIEKNYIIIS